MRIELVMTQPVHVCKVDDTLDRAAQVMWEHDCGVLPIVDQRGVLTGMITDRDICMAAYTQGRPLREVPVHTAMAKDVYSCHVDDTVETAAHLMGNKRIRRVPIVDGDGRPVGLLTLADITRIATSSRKATIRREVVNTLAAICAPRHQAIEKRSERSTAVVQPTI